MDYTKLTLGELMSYTNETIKRNAMSILKTLQKKKCHSMCHKQDVEVYGHCLECQYAN